MNYRCGYTLIELLVVIAIIGMTAVLALPAFAKYRDVTEFTQKTEEVKELFYSAQALANAPETTSVDTYRINFDTATKPHKFILVSCLNPSCSTSTTIRTVPLLDNETIPISGANKTIFGCSTTFSGGKPDSCVFGPKYLAQIIKFSDFGKNVKRVAKFTILNDPFRVKTEISDL
ncbi:hypothetical protein COT78_01175 [Candidatus Berkelbacteria bacterium CG10_big_fil_rev_8_21_14_0_10_43_13]|uniref:Type II secretion system protein GspH n=1 Tax=Candidatus Berkelbacteria bacterium CG10_big_fil_rev_8_21_14_0_10_43_13 TaxID=1974514 RepID=A0A2H0W6X7_9BACT|nr:MAG: hypothetical protein COT78_01175 [Candidatus Berkelbacteria bacterium CG10_big_fil_rev_8_21_14_0_10_43_13]